MLLICYKQASQKLESQSGFETTNILLRICVLISVHIYVIERKAVATQMGSSRHLCIIVVFTGLFYINMPQQASIAVESLIKVTQNVECRLN